MSRWRGECVLMLLVAWVIWAQMNNPTEAWVIHDAFDTKVACEHDLESFLAYMRRQPDISVEGHNVIYRGERMELSLSCSPDTRAPRQTKR